LEDVAEQQDTSASEEEEEGKGASEGERDASSCVEYSFAK
jgi:hypothetical protein